MDDEEDDIGFYETRGESEAPNVPVQAGEFTEEFTEEFT